MKVVSIDDVQSIITEKRSNALKLSDSAYEKVDNYFDYIKEQIMMRVDEEKDKASRLVEKMVYQLD